MRFIVTSFCLFVQVGVQSVSFARYDRHHRARHHLEKQTTRHLKAVQKNKKLEVRQIGQMYYL
ncbi:hypothetical protein CF392_08180 [Tamilnaduibacter salinus]|uniref:Uncharacterized protein n=1 Tax=Tamilnaduibacter salinus TaxID=1484056 RepID=A0A2A2I4J6_9GAMM|nr:hypothetical protein CF392_08180 [Tamilnaduibacter salinus]